MFPPDLLSNHINQKEMHGLYHPLRQLRTRQPRRDAARQVLIDEDNPSVVSAFNHGRAKNRKTHVFPVQLFELQVEYGVRLPSKWNSTAENEVMDVISRPPRNAIIRIAPGLVQAVWNELGSSEVHLVACTSSVLRSPFTGSWCAMFRSFRVP